MYARGEGVERNPAEALFGLGVMHDEGHGMAEDDAEAVRLYRAAAERGLAKAQHNLGAMYVAGEGAPRDWIEAFAWFDLAAERGYPDSPQAREIVRQSLLPAGLTRARQRAAELRTHLAAGDAERLAASDGAAAEAPLPPEADPASAPDPAPAPKPGSASVEGLPAS